MILLFTLFSCRDAKTARFTVYNKSSSKIDSLYFSPSETITRRYLVLEPGEKQKYNLSLANQSSDGAYGIDFRKDGEYVSEKFGYFSNGGAQEKYTVVEIMDDTIIYRPKF